MRTDAIVLSALGDTLSVMSSDVKYDILPKCVAEMMICFAQCTELALAFMPSFCPPDQLNSCLICRVVGLKHC